MGPGPENTAGGKDGPIQRWSKTSGSQRGGEVVVKPKHCWGLGGADLVSPSKSGPESPLCILLLGSSIKLVHSHPRDQEPGRTSVMDRPKGSYIGVFLPKVEVGFYMKK